MRKLILLLSPFAIVLAFSGCQSTKDEGTPAVGYSFESDAAAHIFYQGILDRTELPLQSKTKTKYVDTPLLVVQKVNQVSGASIARESAAKADANGDLEISEAEARSFAGLSE